MITYSVCMTPCCFDVPFLSEHLAFPFIVALACYILFDRLGDWKQRRRISKLGAAVIESLIEEVRNGLGILNNTFNLLAAQPANALIPSLPRKSWSGMSTIPDDVLLRIIESAEGEKQEGFPCREARIHCKNYFEFICGSFDHVSQAQATGGNWIPVAQNLLMNGKYIEATQGVLDMLENTKRLLDQNAKRIIPK